MTESAGVFVSCADMKGAAFVMGGTGGTKGTKVAACTFGV